MKDPIKISVLGAAGRMGRMILKAIMENNQTDLVGATEKDGHEWIGQDIGNLTSGKENGILVTNQPHEVILQSQAIIDFTHPDVSTYYSTLSAQARIVHVIGTTGFSKSQLRKFELSAQH